MIIRHPGTVCRDSSSARSSGSHNPRNPIASKLRFDGGLVYDGPDVLDFSIQKLVEDIFGELHLPAVDREAKKLSLRCTVELQAARHTRRLADQQLDIEEEIGDGAKVAFEHLTIAGQADARAIVTNVLVDE